MAVQTPSYWQEEKYQPLVEAITAYGNKVLIPEKLTVCWEIEQERKKYLDRDKPAVKDGYLKELMGPQEMRLHGIQVFWEIYAE